MGLILTSFETTVEHRSQIILCMAIKSEVSNCASINPIHVLDTSLGDEF